MGKASRVVIVMSLALGAVPSEARNGESRSCASVAASSDGGGQVAFIIAASGAAWWSTFWARARPCG